MERKKTARGWVRINNAEVPLETLRYLKKEAKESTDYALVPPGYRKIEAYTNGERIIVLGIPPEYRETDPEEDRHNCDSMGCSSDHVIYSVEIPEWQRTAQNPEVFRG
jgi:hypothetical protein